MMKRKASLGLGALEQKEESLKLEQSPALHLKEKENKVKKKQPVPIYIDPLLHDALHTIVFSERHKKASFQTLFIEGLELLLEKRGLPSIAELSSGEKTIQL